MNVRLISLVGLFAAGSTAAGQPLVAIGDGQPTSWTAAAASGRLNAVDPMFDGVPPPAAAFYATQGNAAFVPSAIVPGLDVTDDLGVTRNSLLMQWNPLMQGEDMAVASFEYDTMNISRVGGLDLRGQSVHFTLFAPPPIWDLSFMLVDKNGLWAGWFQPMPARNWHWEWIMFNQGNQGMWQYFAQPGFDLSNVVALRLDEAGRIGQFPLPPPGALPGFWDWNAFDSIVITPTPGAGVLIVAAAALAARRRRAV